MNSATNQQSDQEQSSERNKNDGLLLKHGKLIFSAIICFAIVLFFAKVCFGSASISRLCVLAEWDSVFDAWKTGHAQAYDPSLVQIFLPDYVFLAKHLCKGLLPLWNPYCGLGYPFIADIQSSIFAPMRAIFDFAPSLRSYNWYLILEILICAVSTYLLSLALLSFPGQASSQSPGLPEIPGSALRAAPIARCARQWDPAVLTGGSPASNRTLTQHLAALFAAVCYTFCPYNLWYLELNLGTSAVLFPLTTLAFVKAAQTRTLGSAILAGVASGVLILSGHPECSFFGITLASALLVVLMLLNPGLSTSSKIVSALKILVVAAISTIAVSAPSLFPFAEYLLNGESYKFGSTYSTPVTCNGIFFNLCNPGQNGASPYLGIIALLGIPLCLLALHKVSALRVSTTACLIMTVLTFILVSQLGPLETIFAKPPFSAIITRYALPYLLMLESILAAFGLSEFATLLMQRAKTLQKDDKPGEETPLPANEFNLLRQQIGVTVLALVIAPIVISAWSHSREHNLAFLKLADFDAMLPPTAWNKSAWLRDLICSLYFAAGSLVLLATLQFSKLPFAKTPVFKTIEDYSTKYASTALLALALVLGSVSELSLAKLSLPLQSKFFYPQSELIEKLQDTQSRCISTCEYVLRPATNAVYGINFLSVHNPLFPKRFLAYVKACGAETDVFNQKFSSKISPLLNLASIKYILALEPVVDTGGRTAERFHLAFQSKNNIKVYENLDAAPRAFLVQHAVASGDEKESLALIQSNSFDPHTTVIIETPGARALSALTTPTSTQSTPATSTPAASMPTVSASTASTPTASTPTASTPTAPTPTASTATASTPTTSASVTKQKQSEKETYEQVTKLDLPNTNSVRITCNAKSASWLVLTDIYYPGWKAYVDRKPTTIERANFAFRALKLEPGQHEVIFSYEPACFYLACAGFTLFVLLALLVLASRVYKRTL